MYFDFLYFLNWYFLILLVSFLSLPLTFTLFKNFWDKGWVFSKTISILLITFIIFILGVFKILPFSKSNLLLIIFIYFFFNIIFLFRKKIFYLFLDIFKKKYKIFLLEELIFFLILAAWSLLRSYSPDIEGLEKYMDWGFINSALRSKYLPPIDMWYSGEIINYYYFGHLVFAVLTKLSSISSAITYNLSVATLCSLSFLSSFSIATNLLYLSSKKSKIVKIIILGLVSSFLLTFGGNLHPAYKIVKTNIINYQEKNLNHGTFLKSINDYWYPDATRFIGFDPDSRDKTIHEFPSYSFVVSDLHGHLNGLPIVLLFMAFLLSVSTLSLSTIINPFLIIGSAFILSLAYMTNAWDLAIYGLLFAIFTFLLNLRNQHKNPYLKTFINGGLTLLFFFLFSLPFSLNFTPMVNGIRFVDHNSLFYQLLVLYGGFWLILFPPFFLLLSSFFKKKIDTLTVSDLFFLSLVVTATLLIIIPELIYLKDIYIYEHRRANTMFKLVYQAFVMYSLASSFAFFKIKQLLKSKILLYFYRLVFILVFFVHLSYPFFSIKSFYGSLKDRQGLWGLSYLKDSNPDNYHAIDWINKNIKGQPVMLEAVGDSYTTFNQVSVSTGLPTVQGWIVHEWLWRGNYELPKNRQDDVSFIYQSGVDSKSLMADQSSEYIVNQGDSLWSISLKELGDAYHWKDIALANKINNPSLIYTGQILEIPIINQDSQTDDFNLSRLKNLLQKYQIKYIFVGDKEYEKYPKLNLDNFEKIGAKIIFQSGKTKIYQL